MTVMALATYIRAREAIRLRREQGEDPPWTDDPILQKYKFTNVHRQHDRTTRELYEVYQAHAPRSTPETVLYNCALYRYFGTSEFARAVGWLRHHDAAHIGRVARTRLTAKERVFTGAYIVTNCGQYGPKEEVVASFLGNVWALRERIVTAFHEYRSWQAAYKQLTQAQGFGGKGFYAKETLLDYMLCYPGVALDELTWSPVGPGARRGINRLMRRPVRFAQTEDKFIDELREIHYWLKQELSWAILSIHDVQWNLCEFDKYERVRLGEGRPRSKYVYKTQDLHSDSRSGT